MQYTPNSTVATNEATAQTTQNTTHIAHVVLGHNLMPGKGSLSAHQFIRRAGPAPRELRVIIREAASSFTVSERDMRYLPLVAEARKAGLSENNISGDRLVVSIGGQSFCVEVK